MMNAIVDAVTDICPECKVSRNLLREMLAEGPRIEDIEQQGIAGCVIHTSRRVESQNHGMARIIRGNCSACEAAISLGAK